MGLQSCWRRELHSRAAQKRLCSIKGTECLTACIYQLNTEIRDHMRHTEAVKVGRLVFTPSTGHEHARTHNKDTALWSRCNKPVCTAIQKTLCNLYSKTSLQCGFFIHNAADGQTEIKAPFSQKPVMTSVLFDWHLHPVVLCEGTKHALG